MASWGPITNREELRAPATMGGKGCNLPPDPCCPSSRYFLDSTLETSLVSTFHSDPRPWLSACPKAVALCLSQACVHCSHSGPHNLDALKNGVGGGKDARLGGKKTQGGLGVQEQAVPRLERSQFSLFPRFTIRLRPAQRAQGLLAQLLSMRPASPQGLFHKFL